MPLEIRRLPQARADRVDIWLFIASDNLAAADKITDRLEEAVQLLADYPQSGRERSNLGKDIRAFPVESFMIYYRIAAPHLEVVRILHSARDVTPEMLAD